ncbi:MAG: hypothetical protein IT270_20240 [Saprospiraceae bacterium]|nr:hypothetical protein [Saprospiraceae bacterium]
MKNILLFVALFGFSVSSQANISPDPITPDVRTTDFELVVTPKRIWVVAGETPVKSLLIQVIDCRNRVVMEKNLSSKQTDWSLNVQNLPVGKYDVVADGKKVATLDTRLPGA